MRRFSLRRRLPLSSTLFVLLAVACGVAAFVVVRGAVVAAGNGAGAVAGSGATVLVATRDLTPADVIGADDVAATPMDATAVPPGALTSADQAVGSSPTAAIASGEVLTATRLGRGGPLARILPAGSVAFQVEVAAVPTGLREGDHVDVLGNRRRRTHVHQHRGRRCPRAGLAAGLPAVVVLDRGDRGDVGGAVGHPGGCERPRDRERLRAFVTRRPALRSVHGCAVGTRLAWAGSTPAQLRRNPPRVRPAGHHPGSHAGCERVRARLELGPPDPGALALRLVHRSRHRPEQDVRRGPAYGDPARGGHLLPTRHLALSEGVGFVDPASPHRRHRPTHRVGLGDRHDPGRARGSDLRERDPRQARAAVVDRRDVRGLRRGPVGGGPCRAARSRVRHDRHPDRALPRHRPGGRAPAGRLALRGHHDRRTIDRARPRARARGSRSSCRCR